MKHKLIRMLEAVERWCRHRQEDIWMSISAVEQARAENAREPIPLAALELGQAYEVDGRNISIGIWDGRAFHGIRHKFGDYFIDSEIHYDLDDKYGTAQAMKRL